MSIWTHYLMIHLQNNFLYCHKLADDSWIKSPLCHHFFIRPKLATCQSVSQNLLTLTVVLSPKPISFYWRWKSLKTPHKTHKINYSNKGMCHPVQQCESFLIVFGQQWSSMAQRNNTSSPVHHGWFWSFIGICGQTEKYRILPDFKKVLCCSIDIVL